MLNVHVLQYSYLYILYHNQWLSSIKLFWLSMMCQSHSYCIILAYTLGRSSRIQHSLEQPLLINCMYILVLSRPFMFLFLYKREKWHVQKKNQLHFIWFFFPVIVSRSTIVKTSLSPVQVRSVQSANMNDITRIHIFWIKCKKKKKNHLLRLPDVLRVVYIIFTFHLSKRKIVFSLKKDCTVFITNKRNTIYRNYFIKVHHIKGLFEFRCHPIFGMKATKSAYCYYSLNYVWRYWYSIFKRCNNQIEVKSYVFIN